MLFFNSTWKKKKCFEVLKWKNKNDIFKRKEIVDTIDFPCRYQHKVLIEIISF